MKQINYKKLILPNIPYVFFVYLFDKVGQAVRLAPGADISEKILHITQGFSAAFENALPSVHPLDLLVGIVGAVIIRLIVYVKGKNAKKYRKGAEYGSARWGSAEDIKPYVDPDFQNNIILTQTERLTMNSRPKQPKYARNKNVVVIGGSGSGKTRFFVKPNLMQLHSSYVLTDPKGTVLIECGKLLQRAGYRIKVLNTINFRKSMHYNPFVYIHSEKDILKLVNTLIANTKGEGEKSAEDFWVKAERLLYCALVGYIWYEAPKEEMNFITLLELINASEAREDDEEYQSPVDLLFADLEERDPDHFAVKQYRKYKLAAGKTAKSILISCGARLAPFDIKELRDLMSYDELELDTLGDRKTALFLIMSDTDSTFNFVIAMLQSQLFNLLCDKADDEYGGKLPVHVRCLLDEFANIGQIPQFEKLIATIRSREISASIILQSQSQLKAIYKDAAEIILDNADSTLFLGGRGKNAKDTLASVFLILFFVILAIATIASVVYSRYVTKPVLRLSEVSKEMSELNFNWKCKEDRTDELGVLAHSLNEMSMKLSAALENLQNANAKLQADIEHERELEQAQLDFFSAVSHELKTPITIIKGQTEGMILNVGDYQNRSKYLSRSLEIINTMENMVQEILTVSRIKSSKVGLRKETIDFSALLKGEYALFEDLIVQKEIDWNEDISPSLHIVADKMLIQKAINNIISNAILYSPESSSIYMNAFSENGAVNFRLENTGVHIPDDELPKLFDAFYRIERSRNKKTGGSGLGLYIVKTILEQHNIIYSLKNTDRGVLFSIQF